MTMNRIETALSKGSTPPLHTNRFHHESEEKKILLVYPTIPTLTYWSFSTALKMLGRKSAFPPLGIVTVAAMLPNTCHFRLIDMNVEPLTDDDLQWADAVFLSAMIVQKDSFQTVVKRAHAFSVPVVAGGPYPSTAFKELPDVDHFVIGEAENTLDIFWNDFSQGKAKRAYARVAEQAEYDLIHDHFGEDADVERVSHYPNVDITPVPRFDLLKMNKYRSMSVQTSRGCPIGCEFCDIWRRFGRKPRSKAVENLERELDELYRLNWRGSVFVVDDNFVGNKKLAKEILRFMAQWQEKHHYPFHLFTEATLTIANDDELLECFHQAGFDMVFIGIESPSMESLKETRKFINTRGSIIEKVEKIQRSGLQVTAGFIVGFDNDPDDISDLMIQFIQDLGIPVAMVGLMQALPETDLYDRLEREGRLISNASGNNTHAFQTNFVTKRPMADVSLDYQKILQAIYPLNLKEYFKRCMTLRKRWRPPKYQDYDWGVRWGELRAFFSYIFTAPFKAYRFHSLKFLLTTALQKPQFFVTAISLGIQGHHFREITRSAFEIVHLADYFAEKQAAFSRMVSQCMDSTTRSREALLAEYCRFRDETLYEAKKKFRKLRKDVRVMIAEEHERFIQEINDLYQKIEMTVSTGSTKDLSAGMG